MSNLIEMIAVFRSHQDGSGQILMLAENIGPRSLKFGSLKFSWALNVRHLLKSHTLFHKRSIAVPGASEGVLDAG